MNRLTDLTDADRRQFQAFCNWQRETTGFSSTVSRSAVFSDAYLESEKNRASYLESRLEYVNAQLEDNKVRELFDYPTKLIRLNWPSSVIG